MKSGYWLACSLDHSEVRVAAQSKPSLNDMRSQVWKVNTAPKINFFYVEGSFKCSSGFRGVYSTRDEGGSPMSKMWGRRVH